MSFKSSFTTPAVAAISYCLIGGTTPVLADIINVPGDQPTIQAGIDAAMDGDEVVVADGTYIGAGNKNLTFNDGSLTLRSANGPANCVIDCEDDGRGFFFVNETGTIIVEGFTVTRGFVGIDSPGSRRGGAVYCVHSFATFVNCIFDDNRAHAGGGVFVAESDAGAVFINCQITNHVFDGDGSNEDIHTGGGAFVRSGANVEFINCTIADNAVLPGGDHVGGGIHVRDDSSILLANCVLWGNSAEFGDQIGVTVGGIVTVHYSDVQGGEAEVGVVDDDGTVNWGDGNIDADPLFVDPDNGDSRLSPGSPCIDAADNTAVPKGIITDLDGNPRFVDDPDTKDTGNGDPPIVDMGAYEFQVSTTPPDDFSAFRGFLDSGTLADVLESDDSDLCYNPGIVLNPAEAPVTLDFFGTLANDSPATLDVTIESSANTVGLELTISFWNFNTNSWDVVGTDTQSLNVDAVRTFAGIPADHVEPGTGEVITRYEVRVVSFIFLFPWTDCVDHVFWTTSI